MHPMRCRNHQPLSSGGIRREVKNWKAEISFYSKLPLDCNILTFGAHYFPRHKPGTILKSADKKTRLSYIS